MTDLAMYYDCDSIYHRNDALSANYDYNSKTSVQIYNLTNHVLKYSDRFNRRVTKAIIETPHKLCYGCVHSYDLYNCANCNLHKRSKKQ